MHALRWCAPLHVCELPRYQLRVPWRRRYVIVAGDATRWPSLVEMSSYTIYYSLSSKAKKYCYKISTSTNDNNRRTDEKWYATINCDSMRRDWAEYWVGLSNNWYCRADIGWVSYHIYYITIQSSVANVWVHFEHTTTNIEEKYHLQCMECLYRSKRHNSLYG